MWLLYGGAVILSLLVGFRLTSAPDLHLAETTLIVVSVQVFIAGMAMAGPVFNTQLGILFWTLAAVAHGAADGAPSAARPGDVEQRA